MDKKIFKLFQEIGLILRQTISSAFLPILNVLASVVQLLIELQEEQVKSVYKIIKDVQDNSKKYARLSATIYQVLLFIYEAFLFYKIVQGRIDYTSFDIIISYTFAIITFSVAFIMLMQKYYKSSNYSYIVYAQLLLLMPLIIVYWVTYIEGRTIYLKNLNADQWIAIFNTIIIYFSGCFIGLVGMYKNEKDSKTNSKK